MPDFVKGGMGYMQDIAVGPHWISYETRMVPNLEVLDDIADHWIISPGTRNQWLACTAKLYELLVKRNG